MESLLLISLADPVRQREFWLRNRRLIWEWSVDSPSARLRVKGSCRLYQDEKVECGIRKN